MGSHLRHQLVIRVEDSRAAPGNGLDDDALDGRQLAQRIDLFEAEVVAGDVQHDGNIVGAIAEALAKDAAAGHLENGEVDPGILEHHAGRPRAACVRLLDQATVDVDAVGGGHPDLVPEAPDDMGDHARGRGLPIGAGDGDDRDARRRPLWKEHVDHRLGDVLRLALGRVGMHAEAGRGVDFDDGAAGLAHRLADVRREEVDAGDVQAHHAGRLLRNLDVVVIGLEGAIDRDAASRHIGGGRQLDDGILGRHLVEGEALLYRELLGRLVELDAGQHLFMTNAASRVLVGDLDQLTHRVLTIPDHVGRDPFRHRHHVTVDDEHAVIVALDEALDDHDPAAGLPESALKTSPHVLLGTQLEAHATPMVAIERLGDDRVPDAERGGDRLVVGPDEVASRHR